MSRAQPVISPYLDMKTRQRAYKKHADALATMKPTIDTSHPPPCPRLEVYKRRLARERRMQLRIENDNIRTMLRIEKEKELAKSGQQMTTEELEDFLDDWEDQLDDVDEELVSMGKPSSAPRSAKPLLSPKLQKDVITDGGMMVVDETPSRPLSKPQPHVVKPFEKKTKQNNLPVHKEPLSALRNTEGLSDNNSSPGELSSITNTAANKLVTSENDDDDIDDFDDFDDTKPPKVEEKQDIDDFDDFADEENLSEKKEEKPPTPPPANNPTEDIDDFDDFADDDEPEPPKQEEKIENTPQNNTEQIENDNMQQEQEEKAQESEHNNFVDFEEKKEEIKQVTPPPEKEHFDDFGTDEEEEEKHTEEETKRVETTLPMADPPKFEPTSESEEDIDFDLDKDEDNSPIQNNNDDLDDAFNVSSKTANNSKAHDSTPTKQSDEDFNEFEIDEVQFDKNEANIEEEEKPKVIPVAALPPKPNAISANQLENDDFDMVIESEMPHKTEDEDEDDLNFDDIPDF